MIYTIRDLWNDILNVDLITVGQVIIGVVAIFIIISIYLWWEKKLESDSLIISGLWFLMPFAILIGGALIYSHFK
jgi:hypothetical protein